MIRAEELLAVHSLRVSKLLQLKLSLSEKLDVLKQLDNENLGMVEEEKVVNEIEQSDEFKKDIYAFTVRIERALATPHPTSFPPGSVTVAHSPSSASSRAKLPKLTLQPFDGELTSWTPFWDSFRATAHENCSLSDADKFNYLRGSLQRTALETISGLLLTSANYREAVTILEQQFRNKSQIVARHMDILIRVEPVTSPSNIKGLRHLYDLVESNIQGLRSLGVDSSSYGSLLAQVLITKIPPEL